MRGKTKKVEITKVPDDTRGDCYARPSTWGIYRGPCPDSKIGKFYCRYCNHMWVFNFPRYDKILDRTNHISDAKKWPCPGCVQKTLVLVEENDESE